MKNRIKATNRSRPHLSRLELAIMGVVWDLGECSSAEVITAYRKQRKLAPTTIRTVLANLRKKGYLEPVPTVERGFRLKPTISRAAIAKRSLKEILKNLFQGSPRQLILNLVSEENLSDEDWKELRQLIESRKSAD
jgi:predicted transcriptional regulator